MTKVLKKLHANATGRDKLSKFTNPISRTKLWKKGVDKSDKIFNKVWENPIGKIAIIAVAAYFTAGAASSLLGGGAAGGTAGVGSELAAGTLAGGTAAAEGAAIAGYSVGAGLPAAASTAAAEGAAIAGYSVGAGLPAAAGAGAGSTTLPAAVGGGSGFGTVDAGAGYAANTPAAVEGASIPGYSLEGGLKAGGIVSTIKNLGSGVLQFTENNQLLAAMGVSGFANALNYREQLRYTEEQRKRRERNLLVGDIDLGRIRPSGRPLTRISTGEPVYGQGGIINSRLGG